MSENFEKRLTPEPQPEPVLELEKAEIEKELSPEVIEKIMEKVQDINENGTGVHAIRDIEGKSKDETLSKILRNGLLGHERDRAHLERGKFTPKEWADRARQRKKLLIFFNIVGANIDSVEDDPWMGSANPIGVIFSTKHLKYEDSTYNESADLKTRTFGPAEHPTFGPSHDVSFSSPSEGYALSFRLAPRLFEGIIFRVDKQIIDEKELKILVRDMVHHKSPVRGIKTLWRNSTESVPDFFVENTDEATKKQRCKEISDAEQQNMKEKYWLPIYDSKGNLWWPRQMSYEEVKKFVSEKEKEEK